MNHRNDRGFNMGKPSQGFNSQVPGNNDFNIGHNNGGMNTRTQLNLEVGFNPYSKKLEAYSKERELVVGINYSGFSLISRNSNKFAITPGDTFSHNSGIYQTDTIRRTHHRASRGSQHPGCKCSIPV